VGAELADAINVGINTRSSPVGNYDLHPAWISLGQLILNILSGEISGDTSQCMSDPSRNIFDKASMICWRTRVRHNAQPISIWCTKAVKSELVRERLCEMLLWLMVSSSCGQLITWSTWHAVNSSHPVVVK